MSNEWNNSVKGDGPLSWEWGRKVSQQGGGPSWVIMDIQDLED